VRGVDINSGVAATIVRGSWMISGALVSSGLWAQVFFPEPDAKECHEREVKAVGVVTREAPAEARVVRLVEAFEEGGLRFMVMTPLCGASFQAVIDGYSAQPYSLEEALLWGVQLAIVLHTLHSRCRLFHGDISARNVLLGPDKHVYLADLGLAEHNHPYGMRRGDDGLVLWRNTGGEALEMKDGDSGYDSTAEVRKGLQPYKRCLPCLPEPCCMVVVRCGRGACSSRACWPSGACTRATRARSASSSSSPRPGAWGRFSTRSRRRLGGRGRKGCRRGRWRRCGGRCASTASGGPRGARSSPGWPEGGQVRTLHHRHHPPHRRHHQHHPRKRRGPRGSTWGG
jgi:hypothetical protein